MFEMSRVGHNTIVFLDLEETVIDNWSSGKFLDDKIEKIRRNLHLCNVSLGLMSWAMWDEKDRATFDRRFREPLESALGRRFDPELTTTMIDWSDFILRRRKKWVSRDDMFDLYSKEECLLSFLRMGVWENRKVILIDDVVDHDLKFTLNNGSVRFINVDNDFKSWNVGDTQYNYGSWREE